MEHADISLMCFWNGGGAFHCETSGHRMCSHHLKLPLAYLLHGRHQRNIEWINVYMHLGPNQLWAFKNQIQNLVLLCLIQCCVHIWNVSAVSWQIINAWNSKEKSLFKNNLSLRRWILYKNVKLLDILFCVIPLRGPEIKITFNSYLLWHQAATLSGQ